MLSSLKLSSTTILGKEQQKKLNLILSYLIDNPQAAQFLHPVEWQTLGLMDYLSVVKHPMHLLKVQEKLKGRQYKFVQEVLDHIQLIWDNCKDYNPSGPFFSLADKMERSYKKMIKNYLPYIQIVVPSSKISKDVESQPIFPAAKVQTTNTPQQQKIKPTQSKSAVIEEPISEQEPQEIPQSEKNRFNQRLKQITQQELAQIVTIIQEQSPQAFKQIGSNRSQIIIDSIDPNTFKKINERIDDFLEGEKGVTKKVKLS